MWCHIFYYGFLYVISVLFNFQGSSCLLHGCHSEDDKEVSLRRHSSAGFGGQLHEARRADLCTTYVWLWLTYISPWHVSTLVSEHPFQNLWKLLIQLCVLYSTVVLLSASSFTQPITIEINNFSTQFMVSFANCFRVIQLSMQYSYL